MNTKEDLEETMNPDARRTFRVVAAWAAAFVAIALLTLTVMGQIKSYVIETSLEANAIGSQASKQTHAEHERAIEALQVDVRDLKARAERCSDRITSLDTDLRVFRAERPRSHP